MHSTLLGPRELAVQLRRKETMFRFVASGLFRRPVIFLLLGGFWCAYTIWIQHRGAFFELKPGDLVRSNVKSDLLSSPVLEPELCTGFAEQQIQLVKTVMLGAALGAQVLLPKEGFHVWDLLVMPKVLEASESLVRDIACATAGMHRQVWCSKRGDPAILFLEREEITVSKGRRSILEIEDVENISDIHDRLWKSNNSMAQVSCDVVMSLPVVEPSAQWDQFWNIWNKAMVFADDVHQAKVHLQNVLRGHFAAAAWEKAQPMGYRHTGGAFNVLHLRAEENWKEFCTVGFRTSGQNNCMNNTFEVANVLLSEGITPTIPLYVATGLSKTQLEEWRATSVVPSSTNNLFNVYTIATHDMVSEMMISDGWTLNLEHHNMFWPAVNFLLGLNAKHFIGNSVSMFSALLMQVRLRAGEKSIHYNGGGVPLQDTNQLNPSRKFAMSTFRTPIKWLFCIQRRTQEGPAQSSQPDIALNMATVAIKSALQKTSLIPVGVTLADPKSKFAAQLVSMGVRLIYHTPSWVDYVESTIRKWNGSSDRFAGGKKPSHLLSDVDAMVGTFMRIDIPIVGILDPFVFYADIDVIFQRDVTWQGLLGHEHVKIMERNDFARGIHDFGKPNEDGLPTYFSMSAEVGMVKKPMNAGVMLLNMLSLRDTYKSFLAFIMDSGDITWEIGPGDQGALMTFYREKNGTPSYSFLPLEFNWKAYWPKNPEAALVHFHGPKCESDILPYFKNGEVRNPLFQHLLRICGKKGNCRALCEKYQAYLKP